MSEKINLSIIIPAYNVEKYIVECLESLKESLNDNYSHEIIIVNDGSTDNTLEIINSFKLENKELNLIIMNQLNQGQSVARNNGISLAKGKYISFVDADDKVNKDIYSKSLVLMDENDLDILNFQFYNDFNNPKENFTYKIKSEALKVYKGSDYLKYNPSLSPCDKIYTTNFLRENKFNFAVGRYAEDALAISLIMYKATRIMYLNETFYIYRRDSIGSTRNSMSLTHAIKLGKDKLYVSNKLFEANKEYKNTYLRRLANRNIIGVYLKKQYLNKEYRKEIRKESKRYRSIKSLIFNFRFTDIFYYLKVFFNKIFGKKE